MLFYCVRLLAVVPMSDSSCGQGSADSVFILYNNRQVLVKSKLSVILFRVDHFSKLFKGLPSLSPEVMRYRIYLASKPPW